MWLDCLEQLQENETFIDAALEANLRLFAHLCVQKFEEEAISRFQQTNLSKELDIVFSRVASEMIMA